MAVIGNIVIGMGVNSKGLSTGLTTAASQITLFGGRLENTMAATMSASDRIKAFGLNAADLAEGLEGKTLPRVRSFSGALAKLGITSASAMTALKGGAIAAAAAVGSLVTGLFAHGFATLKTADDTLDLADRLGTTAGKLMQLRYIAQLSGSDVTAMDAAVAKLSANLADAAVKSTPAGQALARLGLDAKTLAAMDPADAVKAIIENFGKLPSASDQAAAAMDLFGKSGLGIVGTLKIGKDRLAELSAESLGLEAALSGVSAEQIGKANDAMDKLSFAMTGFGTVLAAKIAPTVTELVTSTTKWLQEATKEGSTVMNAFDLLNDTLSLTLGIVSALSKLSPLPALGAIGAWMIHQEERFPGEKKAAADQAAAEPAAAAASANAAAAIDQKFLDALAHSRDWEAQLQEQIATFGESADAVELYRLEVAGLSDEQRKSLEQLVEQKSQLEENKRAWDQMTADAKRFYDETRTPAEKQLEIAKNLESLLDHNLISQDTYNRAIKANTAAPKATDTLEDVGPRFARTAEIGSAEAYSAILRFQAQGSRDEPQKKLLKNAEESLEVQREMLQTLKAKPTTGLEVFSLS